MVEHCSAWQHFTPAAMLLILLMAEIVCVDITSLQYEECNLKSTS